MARLTRYLTPRAEHSGGGHKARDAAIEDLLDRFERAGTNDGDDRFHCVP
jgi:hypothetical protein